MRSRVERAGGAYAREGLGAGTQETGWLLMTTICILAMTSPLARLTLSCGCPESTHFSVAPTHGYPGAGVFSAIVLHSIVPWLT
jgi:hypothetical protein